jgi:hypothetical protein
MSLRNRRHIPIAMKGLMITLQIKKGLKKAGCRPTRRQCTNGPARRKTRGGDRIRREADFKLATRSVTPRPFRSLSNMLSLRRVAGGTFSTLLPQDEIHLHLPRPSAILREVFVEIR